MRKFKSKKSILKQALKLLRDKGWTREAFQDEEGRHCLMGAMECSLGGESNWFVLDSGRGYDYPEGVDYNLAHELLGFKNRSSAYRFNDAKKRTFKDIETRLEEAIEQS